MFRSLRDRRSKGNWGRELERDDRARGRREEGNLSFVPRAPKSPSPFNACHAGYVFRKQLTLPMLTTKTHGNFSAD